jgi:fucose permease
MLVLSAASFFVLGIALVILGVHQAELARALALDLTQSGLLGAMLALGLGIGVVAAGPLADRLARKPMFVVSCGVAGALLLVFAPPRSYAWSLVLITFIGIACGFYETLVNVTVVQRYRAKASGALAFVHSAATAGAAVGPLLLHVVSAESGWARSFQLLGVLHLLLAAAALAVHMPAPQQRDRSARAPAGVSRLPLGALALIGFSYVGVESVLTLFAVPWSEQRGELASVGQAGISGFWQGLLAGRLLLALRPAAGGAALLSLCGLLGGACVLAIDQLALKPFALALGVTGLVLGPVYPLMITLTAQRFPQSAATTLGLVAGAGACGGFVLPFVCGWLADTAGLSRATSLLVACALAIVLAASWLARQAAAQASSEGS